RAEPVYAPAWQRDGRRRGERRLEAVLREERVGNEHLAPVGAGLAALLDPDVADAQVPADTEVAAALVAAVVPANELYRKTSDRQLEIREGQREVAELHPALHGGRDARAGLAAARLGRDANGVHAVQQYRRIECAEDAVGGAVSGGDGRERRVDVVAAAET